MIWYFEFSFSYRAKCSMRLNTLIEILFRSEYRKRNNDKCKFVKHKSICILYISPTAFHYQIYLTTNHTNKSCEMLLDIKLQLYIAVMAVSSDYITVKKYDAYITQFLIPTHAHFHWLKFIKNI